MLTGQSAPERAAKDGDESKENLAMAKIRFKAWLETKGQDLVNIESDFQKNVTDTLEKIKAAREVCKTKYNMALAGEKCFDVWAQIV